MKKVLIALAFVTSLAVVNNVTAQDKKADGQKKECKKSCCSKDKKGHCSNDEKEKSSEETTKKKETR